MKFSYRWLAELVPGLSIDPTALQRLITMKTAECEGIESFGSYFNHVVAARVVEVEPLPKGKNKSVLIDNGSDSHVRVVCGAANVRPGMIALWRRTGSCLFVQTVAW
jgi:phenylalanyl-tRNA synthetase beta chain